MAVEIADLGFDHMELSHGIRVSLVPGILKAIDEGVIQVSTVHNFCPLPPGVNGAAPNLYQPSRRSQPEQDMWRRHTLRTLDFGARVGAKVMVTHSGSVDFFWRNPEAALEGYEANYTGDDLAVDDNFIALREKGLARMRKKQSPFIDRLLDNFRFLTKALEDTGIKLGLENREGFTELPLDLEIRGVLGQLEPAGCFGYWHDTGHAQLKERLGIISHEALLNDNKDRHLGFHLHNVSEEGDDHQPLYAGVIDWPMVRRFIQPHHICVLELSPRLRSAMVVDSLKFAREELGLGETG